MAKSKERPKEEFENRYIWKPGDIKIIKKPEPKPNPKKTGK